MDRRALALAALATIAACRNPQPCPTPLEECAGQCVDLQSDRRNCGQCGRACLALEVCTGAACTPDARAACPDRIGGAFVTFGFTTCAETAKLWISQPAFLDEAASYVGTTSIGRTPVLAVLAGSDCDGQWSWNVVDDTPAFQDPAPLTSTGCDVCPRVIQANVPTFISSSGKWCPTQAKVLAVDRR